MEFCNTLYYTRPHVKHLLKTITNAPKCTIYGRERPRLVPADLGRFVPSAVRAAADCWDPNYWPLSKFLATPLGLCLCRFVSAKYMRERTSNRCVMHNCSYRIAWWAQPWRGTHRWLQHHLVIRTERHCKVCMLVAVLRFVYKQRNASYWRCCFHLI